MKQITRQRILKALEHNARLTNSKPEVHVIQTLAKVGLESAAARAFKDNREPFTDRDRLELAYQDFTDTEKISSRLSQISVKHDRATTSRNKADSRQNRWPMGLTDHSTHGCPLYYRNDLGDDDDAIKKAWFTLFQHTIQRSIDRDRHILKIQQRHSISGLEEVELNFGGKVVKCHTPNDSLGLLTSDLYTMNAERMSIARKFVQASRCHKMKLYRYNYAYKEWNPVSAQLVLAYAFDRIWVKAWTEEDYINHDELHRDGYTTVKQSPETSADKLSLEFHLVVSNNCSLNSNYQLEEQSGGADWFCAKLDED